jgi:hypothetical protein
VSLRQIPWTKSIARTRRTRQAPSTWSMDAASPVAFGRPWPPDLFAWEEDYCYVKRQPSTQAEMERMIDASRVVDVSCIRYRGRDPTVFERLGALGEPDLADFPPAEGIPVVLRNHVTFETLDGNPAILEEVVADFRSLHAKRGCKIPRSAASCLGPLDMVRICLAPEQFPSCRRLASRSPQRPRPYFSFTNSGRPQSNGFRHLKWVAFATNPLSKPQGYSAEEWAKHAEAGPTPW